MKKAGTHIIIQARMGSSRLPGKILMSFIGEYTPLRWIIERARLSKYAEKVIVATSINPKDDATEKACKEAGCEVYRGSEDDVLKRFIGTVRMFDTKLIVQINGDEPFVDIIEMDRLVDIAQEEELAYANNHPGGLPLGTGAEVYTREAFERVAREADTPYDHEHVTPYFYHHPELFKQCIVEPTVPHPFAPQVRLTLDTAEDLEMLTALAQGMDFPRPEEQPSTNEIVSFLQEHPEIVMINNHVVQKTFPKA